MLTWYEKIYVGNTAKKNETKIRRKLDQGKFVPGVYLITMASNPANNLDIIGTAFLKQKAVYERCPMVVGMAKGYEEALELVQQITEDVLAQTGDAGIRNFFLNG